MKNLITVLALFTMVTSFGQNTNATKSLRGDINANIKVDRQIKNSIEVTTNSLKEIDAKFSLIDIEDIVNEMPLDEDVVFKMTCSQDRSSNVAYKVKGNTNDIKKFINDVSDVREKAIKFYKSK